MPDFEETMANRSVEEIDDATNGGLSRMQDDSAALLRQAMIARGLRPDELTDEQMERHGRETVEAMDRDPDLFCRATAW